MSYPAIGQTNADLDFSPDEKTLLIADTDLDLLFFLYVNGSGNLTNIETVPDGGKRDTAVMPGFVGHLRSLLCSMSMARVDLHQRHETHAMT